MSPIWWRMLSRRTRPLAAGRVLAVAGVSLGVAACDPAPPATPAPTFSVHEATIADIHAALETGRATCMDVVRASLDRIAAYDKQGPALNAVVTVNPSALDRARDLDDAAARGAPRGRLHCVPAVVKENYDTADLPTTAGSAALEGFRPDRDAFQVRRLREAGAVVVAKTNMAELAFSPYETVSSILPGYTRNPYDLRRSTAGSSGGTAAAVAASLATIGLGTDTGNSIRGPSSHQALVGMRSTMGLTSRAGIVPLNLAADIGGPMTRTVTDAAIVLEVIEGVDPDDAVTSAARERDHPPYLEQLDPDALRGARLGVVRELTATDTADPDVIALFDAALTDLEAAGAVVVDPAPLVGFADIGRRRGEARCPRFKRDLNAYLAARASAPRQSLADIVASGRFHPSIRGRLEAAEAGPLTTDDSPGCRAQEGLREELRAVVHATLERDDLEALLYPTWSNRPRLIGDLTTPHGDNNQVLSPVTGFPALTIPMGYVEDRLPAGLQLLGRPWSEGRLLSLAYAYERATRHRRAPASTPAL